MKKYYFLLAYFYFYLGDAICIFMEFFNMYSLYKLYKTCMNKSVKYQDKGDGNGPWINLR